MLVRQVLQGSHNRVTVRLVTIEVLYEVVTVAVVLLHHLRNILVGNLGLIALAIEPIV